MKKIFVILIVLLCGLVGCKNDDVSTTTETNGIDMTLVLDQFDLTEEKRIWDGVFYGDMYVDHIIKVYLKKTYTYVKLDAAVFNIPNIIRIEYSDPESMKNFRQYLVIFIEPVDKVKMTEIIREIEKLEFVYCAIPEIAYKGD